MNEPRETVSEPDDTFDSGRVQSRYQRRSGRLPRLTDQPGANFSLSILPKPVAEPTGPVALLRSLLSA